MRFELRRPYQRYTDTELLDDLRRVARQAGSCELTMAEYGRSGRFAPCTVGQRFGTWLDALERAGLTTEHGRPATPRELIADLQRVAEVVGDEALSWSKYRTLGRYSPSPFVRAFGSWTAAKEAAGLRRHSLAPGITAPELLANLERVWIALGRQPKHSEIRPPLSAYSATTYLKRFGSWRGTLNAFIAWVDTKEADDSTPTSPQQEEPVTVAETPSTVAREAAIRRTPRNANLRLRFRVMRRDRFTCRACGRSPANQPGLALNVDHILPWEKGGETTEDNLQTLCEACNQGKGVLPWDTTAHE